MVESRWLLEAGRADEGVYLSLKCAGCGTKKTFTAPTAAMLDTQIVESGWLLEKGRAECGRCFAEYRRSVESAGRA